MVLEKLTEDERKMLRHIAHVWIDELFDKMEQEAKAIAEKKA